MAVAAPLSSLFSTFETSFPPFQTNFAASRKPISYPLRRPTSSIPPSPVQLNPRFQLTPTRAKSSDEDGFDTSYFDGVSPEQGVPFEPVVPPEDYVPFPSFDELLQETDEQIATAYEEIYDPVYSGVSLLGNDIYGVDAKVKKTSGFGSKRARGDRRWAEPQTTRGVRGVGQNTREEGKEGCVPWFSMELKNHGTQKLGFLHSMEHKES